MQWVKLFTTLHRHVAFRRLSPGAKLVFYVCLELAGDLEQGGALFVRGAGPMTVDEIAGEVGVNAKNTTTGLEALIGIGFMSKRDSDGCYVIDKFDEKTAPKSSTERVRKHRRNTPRETAGNVSETLDTRSQEKEEEEETEGEPPNPRRSRRVPVPAEAIPAGHFGVLEPNVLRVIANDAAERKDGCIAESVIDGLRVRLAKALELYGAEALGHGLQVAIECGRTAAYAAGVARHYNPGEARRGGHLRAVGDGSTEWRSRLD